MPAVDTLSLSLSASYDRNLASHAAEEQVAIAHSSIPTKGRFQIKRAQTRPQFC